MLGKSNVPYSPPSLFHETFTHVLDAEGICHTKPCCVLSSSCSIMRESSVRKSNVAWQPRLRSFMGLFPSQLVCDGYVTSPACSPQTFARPPNISARQNLDSSSRHSSSQLIETEWGDKGGHSGPQRGIQPGSIVHNCWPQKRRNSRF